MDYIRIKFKGGWALLSARDFDPKKHERYVEPEKVPEKVPEPEGGLSDGAALEALPGDGEKGETLPLAGEAGEEPIPEEVTTDAPRSGGRKRAGKR